MSIVYEWYVLNYDRNRKELIYYNIFTNRGVYKDICCLCSTYNGNFDEFCKEVDKILKHYMWARREYEISVGDAFEEDINKYKKVDCYAQVQPNLVALSKYLLREYGYKYID